MAMGKDLISLLDVLSYEFTDISLLDCALTHTSYANEMKSRGIRLPSNERMEFLGDAVLELVISEYIYKNNSRLPEGKLTTLRKNAVCESSLASVAQAISLGEYIHLGKGEENGIVTMQRLFYNVVALTLSGIFVEESNL